MVHYSSIVTVIYLRLFEDHSRICCVDIESSNLLDEHDSTNDEWKENLSLNWLAQEEPEIIYMHIVSILDTEQCHFQWLSVS